MLVGIKPPRNHYYGLLCHYQLLWYSLILKVIAETQCEKVINISQVYCLFFTREYFFPSLWVGFIQEPIDFIRECISTLYVGMPVMQISVPPKIGPLRPYFMLSKMVPPDGLG